MAALPRLPRTWRGRAALATAAALLVATACTAETEPRPGLSYTDFTDRWAQADIAQLPAGTVHRLSRYELNDEVDPLQHDGARRTGYVVRYATAMERSEVIDHYLHEHGDTCTFDTSAPSEQPTMTATCGELHTEIRMLGLLHGPDASPEIRVTRTEVLVFVTDRVDAGS